MKKVIYTTLKTRSEWWQASLKLATIATLCSTSLISPVDIALQSEMYNGDSLIPDDLRKRMAANAEMSRKEFEKKHRSKAKRRKAKMPIWSNSK